jgi:hypothetical protein
MKIVSLNMQEIFVLEISWQNLETQWNSDFLYLESM